MSVYKLASWLLALALMVKLMLSPFATGDLKVSSAGTLNYVTDAVILLVCLAYLNHMHKHVLFIYAAVFALFVPVVASTMLFHSAPVSQTVIAHLKIGIPFLLFCFVAQTAGRYPQTCIRQLKVLIALVWLLIFVGFITLPASENRGAYWLPSYFGGVHTTSYVALASFFGCICLYYVGQFRLHYLVVMLISLVPLFAFGWGVRTILLTLFLFLAMVGVDSVIKKREVYIGVIMPIALCVGFGALLVLWDSAILDDVSSGRLSMYHEKFNQLQANSITAWFIGNGTGSDLIETDVWWWEAKGAHSDVLTFLVEGGIVYLFGIGLIIVKLFNLFDRTILRFVIVAFVFTSLFSNGYIVRPIASYFLMFGLGLAYGFASLNRTVHNDARVLGYA